MEEVHTKMKDAGEKLAKKEKKAKVVGPTEKNLVQPIQKPIHLRSQKPMTRVPVEDVAAVRDFETSLKKDQSGQPKKPFRMPVVDVDESMDTTTTSKKMWRQLEILKHH